MTWVQNRLDECRARIAAGPSVEKNLDYTLNYKQEADEDDYIRCPHCMYLKTINNKRCNNEGCITNAYINNRFSGFSW